MNIITLDFETFWNSADYTLSKMGPIEYIRDPRFEVQLLGVRVNRSPVQVYEKDQIPIVLSHLELERSDRIVIGHNLNGFDGLILSERYGIKPRLMLDTIVMMRWVGLSRIISESHAALTDYFKTGVKRAGTAASNAKHWPQDFTPAEGEDFKRYCGEDVFQCSENFYRMIPYMTTDSVRFAAISARMATEPAFWLLKDLLVQYIQELDARVETSRQEIATLFHFQTKEEFLTAIRSADKFCSMLRCLGQEPPMKYSAAKTATVRAKLEAEQSQLQREGYQVVQPYYGSDSKQVRVNELAEVLADEDNYAVYTPALAKSDLDFLALREHPDERIALLAQMRLANNSSIQRSRAERFLALANTNKPLPIMLNAFKAHTSRYTAGVAEGASDGTQMQNLNKRDPNQLTLRRAIRVPQGYKVVAVDSSQIEARILAYLANQKDVLDQFRHDLDPYSQLAEKIFNVPWEEIRAGSKAGDKKMKLYRNVGKTGILSCLAGDTQVLTNIGWERIDRITKNHKLWDGDSWVQHDGLIYNGKKKTIEVDGVSMTPDHLIFDGTSWSRADVCVSTPQCLNRAMLFAGERFSTLGWENILNILLSAPSADGKCGLIVTIFRALSKGIANIALLAILNTLNIFKRKYQTRSQGVFSESLQFCVLSGVGGIDMLKCNALAEHLPITWGSTILSKENQLDVIAVQRKKLLQRIQKNTLAMWIYVLIQNIGDGCLTGLQLAINVVKTLTMQDISTMARVGYGLNFRAARIVCDILCHWMGGINRSLNWTGLTTTKDINQGTYVLCSENKTSTTVGPCHNYKPVFDILNVGSKQRFLIKSRNGYLLVHNCGYGVGYQKFSDTLLRTGAKMDNDLDKHKELARHAHIIYRLTNSNIVAFWNKCMNVIRHMEQEGCGSFGGPNDDLFEYDHMLLPDGQVVPSIRMPSGFIMRYPNLRVEQNEHGKLEYYYDRQRGKNVIKTKIYGGALAENCCQSLAFQLLMWQACRMDEKGIPLKGNNHDAWIAVCEESQAQQVLNTMTYWMSQTPEWLPNFPVACEGEIGDDYTIC